MSTVNWKELLGWEEDQLEELRFTGFSFLRQGCYEKALIFFKALVILDPTSAYDAQTLGALHLQMGAGKKALRAIDNALLIDPTHETTQLNRVKALLLVGEKGQALSLAQNLSKSEDEAISDDASALVMAYS